MASWDLLCLSSRIREKASLRSGHRTVTLHDSGSRQEVIARSEPAGDIMTRAAGTGHLGVPLGDKLPCSLTPLLLRRRG